MGLGEIEPIQALKPECGWGSESPSRHVEGRRAARLGSGTARHNVPLPALAPTKKGRILRGRGLGGETGALVLYGAKVELFVIP